MAYKYLSARIPDELFDQVRCLSLLLDKPMSVMAGEIVEKGIRALVDEHGREVSSLLSIIRDKSHG